jgi:hypothetical protein
METVEVNKLDYWGWTCPECKEWNETQEDPDYEDEVWCEHCTCTFEPVSA